MRARNTLPPIVVERGNSFLGPLWIALGLGTLLVGAMWPAAPVVTAMAVLAVGATSETLARFRERATLLPVMLLHLAAYISLYALFVGATLHAAVAPPTNGLGGFAAADLAASTLPMAFVLARTWGGLRLPPGPKR